MQIEHSDYWGPQSDFFYEEYQYKPFVPYNPQEIVMKCCEFGQSTHPQQLAYMQQQPQINAQQLHQQQQLAITQQQTPSTQQAIQEVEKDDEFLVVESKQGLKKAGQAKKKYPQKTTTVTTQPVQQIQSKNKLTQKKANLRTQYQRIIYTRTKFKDNTQLQPNWIYLEEAQKTHFEKLNIEDVQVQDLKESGCYKAYDRSYDKTNIKQKKVLDSKDAFVIQMGTMEDPILLDLISEAADNEEQETPQIFIIDSLLTALMTVKHSNFPWEMEVTKVKNVLIIDKLNQSTSYLDLYTANENHSGNLPEEEKEMLKLCLESTNIVINFQNQVCTGEPIFFGEEEQEDELRNVAYKYRKWKVDDFEVNVRCEVESYVTNSQGEQSICLIRAFNEYDLQSEWRSKLDSNKGAVITQEMRNNTSKICKWICQGVLTGAETIKTAFVSRTNIKDSTKHNILQVETFSLKELQQNINFRMSECWTIIKYIVQFLQKQEDGKFALVKVPYKPNLRIYRIPEEINEEEN